MNRAIAITVGVQAAITALGAAASGLFGGTLAAASATVGGAIGLVPNLAYAAVLALAGRGSPETQLRASYAGEAIKIVLTLLMFAATFIAFRGVKFWPLFLTYLGTLASYAITLMLDTYSKNVRP